ncbi:MAG: hypothetical protein R2911_15805 [Caldilineaceae bacterium]
MSALTTAARWWKAKSVNGCQVECPRHAPALTSARAALSFPAFEATNTYAVKIEGDDVLIESPI